MALQFPAYTEPPSKQNPYGVTNDDLRIRGRLAGEEFRKVVDAAKSAHDIRIGAATMYANGFMEVPEYIILDGISRVEARLIKEQKQRIADAKNRVVMHIKSNARLGAKVRNATRNHVRGWV